jgi:hypothetical protein
MAKMLLNTKCLCLREISSCLGTVGRFMTLCLRGEIFICHEGTKTLSVTKSEKLKLNRITGYILIVLILSGTLIFFSACEKILLKNPGKQVIVNKLITPFSEIAVYDIFDIEIKSDSIYSLKLSGYSDNIENISFTIDSGVLKIRDDNKYKWLADYPRTKIIIGFPKIDRIWLEVPVHMISLDSLKLERFELISRGKTAEIDLTLDVNSLILWTGSLDFGYYILKGKAKSCYLWHQGNSIADARQLESENCEVYNFSIGNSFVNAITKLKVHLYSAGNIYYRGNPGEIDIAEQSNKGKLIRLDN